MIRLALAQMLDRPMPTALNILLIGLAGALLLTLATLTGHLNDRFSRDMAGIDLVVSAKGSPLQVILSSVFHVDIPTGNIPESAADSIAKDPLVAAAIPLAIGDRFRGYRVVGTTADYPALYGAQAAQGDMNLDEENAVIGASAAKALGIKMGQRFVVSHGLAGGETSTHEDHPLTVVGILAPTGSVIDRLILTSLEAVWEAHGIHTDHDHGHDHEADCQENHEDEDDHEHGENGHDNESNHSHDAHDAAHDDEKDHAEDHALARAPEVTALLVRYASPLAAVQLPAKINANTQMMAAVPAYETARLLSVFGLTQSAAKALIFVLVGLGILSVFASLWSTLQHREYDLALLRLLGAGRKDVFGLLVLEGGLTACIGAILALVLSRLVLWQLATHVFELGQSGFKPLTIGTGDLGLMGVIALLGIVAAVPAGVKASRLSLEHALS